MDLLYYIQVWEIKTCYTIIGDILKKQRILKLKNCHGDDIYQGKYRRIPEIFIWSVLPWIWYLCNPASLLDCEAVIK